MLHIFTVIKTSQPRQYARRLIETFDWLPVTKNYVLMYIRDKWKMQAIVHTTRSSVLCCTECEFPYGFICTRVLLYILVFCLRRLHLSATTS